MFFGEAGRGHQRDNAMGVRCDLTGKSGWPSTSSPMMQPIAQMSTLLL
jgi:hypothetical protein